MQESADELPVQAGYAAWAPLYDDDGNPLTALEGPAVRAWFGPLAGRRALDIGCGTGRHTLALIEAGAAEIAALDLTPEMMALARAKVTGRHSRVHWIRHALPEPLPFRNATFDLAVLGLVAEHIDDLARALREVARVLTPGGRCIVRRCIPTARPKASVPGSSTRGPACVTRSRRSIARSKNTSLWAELPACGWRASKHWLSLPSWPSGFLVRHVMSAGTSAGSLAGRGRS